ncbi:MAG: methyltransferase domain-containing protein [Flavobacteriaceae bacterium]
MMSKLENKLKAGLNFLREQYYSYRCSVCNSKIKEYLPLSDSYRENSLKYGYKYFGENEHINIKKYTCPNCKASDRDRFYASFFSNIEKIPKNSQKSLLHVAPSWPLNNKYLIKHFNVITTDLMMPKVDYLLDVEDMVSFEPNKFGYLICSHVLEHVNNPDKALVELLRVLKPGGKAILMAPINPNIANTIEDPKHTSEEERLRYYGQEDHLRLFAKQDFMNRIEKAGFILETYGINEFGKKSFQSLGLRETSVLYIGKKTK